MILRLLTIPLLLFLPSLTLSIELIGEGQGLTRETAKQEALSDLSQSIATEVKSVHTGWKELLDGKYSDVLFTLRQMNAQAKARLLRTSR